MGYAVGVGIEAGRGGAGPAEAAVPPTAAQADPAVQIIADHSKDGAHAYALLWTSTSRLWYVLSSPGDQLSLVEYDTATATSSAWNVPVPVGQGPNTYLTADGSGNIWLAANYAVAEFDPANDAFAFSTVLDKEVVGATPSALEPGNPLPGTWVTGLARLSDGSVGLLRNNVTRLFRATGAGVSEAATLSAAPTGFELVDGEPRPYRIDGDTTRLVDDGSAPTENGVASSSGNCGIHSEPARGTVTFSASGRAVVATAVDPRPRDPVALNDAYAVVGLTEDGIVLRLDCKTGALQRYALGASSAIPDGPGATTNNGGAGDVATPILVPHRPQAVAVSPDGRVGVSTDFGEVAVIP